MTNHDVVARVEELERQNRRMKVALVGVIGTLIAIAIAGAAQSQEIPEVVRARSFSVIDDSGDVRVLLMEDAIMHFDASGAMLSMSSGGFRYYDANGTVRSSMDADGTAYYDEQGQERVRLGRGVARGDTVETEIPEGVLAIRDAEGAVLWQQPR